MILQTLGEPQGRTVGDIGDNSEIECLQYASPALELSFMSEDDDRLGTITVRNPDATYDGQRVLGTPIVELLERYPNLKLSDDFEEKGQDYIDDPKGLSFWVIDGVVDSVTIFPDWVDDHTPRWPEIKTTEQTTEAD